MFLFFKLLKWAVLLVLVLAAAIGLTLWLFVFPSSDRPGTAEAVVVLSGGGRASVGRGLGFARDGVAPVLVVYGGGAELCAGGDAFEVVCPKARKDDRAEARALAGLARKRGWRSLVVVASTPDVSRARLVVERCYKSPTAFVAARPSAGAWARAIPGAWRAYLDALMIVRKC